MEYYLAIKRNEVMTHAPTWMNFEDIVPGEISKTQKAKYYMIPLTWTVQNRQIHKNRKQTTGCQGLLEERNGERLQMSARCSSGVMKMFWN